VFRFEDHPNVISIPYTFELPWNNLHIRDIHRAQRLFLFIQTTATLGINDRVNETLGITVELKITSQVADFINQILSYFAYGGSSIAKTLNETSFNMLRMVRAEVEVSASVGRFSCKLWWPVSSLP
jgi:hypothetical protein